jgi:hypothetical protein
MSSGITSLPHFTYSPLQPWQTRIPRLHPRETRAGEEDNNSQLRIDLLAANLHALDGVTVEGDGNLMSYTALSYSGGRPELLDVLLCNGQTRPISRSNAAALKALRHPTQPIHLWIDAVCISQEDVQEESRQVAEMLLIYKKAQSVTAWRGEADDADLLALACIRNPAALSALTSGFREKSHGASCLDSVEGNVQGFALLLRETVAPVHLDPARDLWCKTARHAMWHAPDLVRCVHSRLKDFGHRQISPARSECDITRGRSITGSIAGRSSAQRNDPPEWHQITSDSGRGTSGFATIRFH